jgi:hypothetical protein
MHIQILGSLKRPINKCFVYDKGCKHNNMSHIRPFGTTFWIVLFLEYSIKIFRENILKS